jgi:spore coat polysaccharide biosynthesis protein SpsF
MASSRLPGKVLRDIGGEPMLVRVVERVRRASMVHAVGVATTTDPSDDPVAELCEARGYPFYRGSQFDVLDRFYQAAAAWPFGADVIVRLTADCPVIDPAVIDLAIGFFAGQASTLRPTACRRPGSAPFRSGLDTEVVSLRALERAWKEAVEKHQREHVMPYFYDEEGRFPHSDHRYTARLRQPALDGRYARRP